jgi:hypothetical protein
MSQASTRMLHRLAAIGLLLATLAIIGAVIVLPLAGRFAALRADIDNQRELIGRFEAFAANKDAADAAAEQARTALRSNLFLGGETDALRTANLQALITSLAEKSGVRLSSTRGLPMQEQAGLRLFGVQAEFEIGMKKLQPMLAAYEAQRPALFLQSVQLSPLQSRRRDSDELKVRLNVFAAVAVEAEVKP